MSYAVGKPADQINARMIKFLPELDSDYAKFPMHHERWYKPTEKMGPKGEPCYIKATPSDFEGNIRKKDYVLCKAAPHGPGYYLLMCRVAYINLYTKLDSLTPGTCGCACSAADRVLMDEFDDVKKVLHGRQLSPKPDDVTAYESSMTEAQNWSQANYNADTAVGFVSGVTGGGALRM
jgi:hypothetical protein